MKGYPLGFLVNHLDSIPDVLICNEAGKITQLQFLAIRLCNCDKIRLKKFFCHYFYLKSENCNGINTKTEIVKIL